jgi:dinuclear metal center YbgI/SA1388 family protein
MKASEIITFLEQLAPPQLQEGYDNSGLIVGDANAVVTGVLVSLDCTEHVIDEAIHLGCNMVVSHHPIVFKGLKRLVGKTYVERTVMKAIRNDIILYAIHTNLDNVTHGVNDKIAQRLGLKNTRILAPKKQQLCKLVTFTPSQHADHVRNALFDAGAGAIGNYDRCSFSGAGTGSFRGNEDTNPYIGEKGVVHHEQEERIEVILPSFLSSKIVKALIDAHPYEEVAYDLYPLLNEWSNTGAGIIGELPEETDTLLFLKSLRTSMNTECIRYTLPQKEKVRHIAVCGGSGSSLLPNAIAVKADVFITADFTYHQFFDAEDQIIIADIGHYESEQFTIQLLAEKLVDYFPKFAIHLTRVRTNPVHYL